MLIHKTFAMATHHKTSERVKVLTAMLTKLKPGEELPVEELIAAIRHHTGPKTFGGEKKSRDIKQLIHAYHDNSNAREVEVTRRHTIRFIEPAVAQFKERMEKRAAEKSDLSIALLHWIFDARNAMAGYGATSKTVPVPLEGGLTNYPFDKPLNARFNWAREEPEKSFIERRLLRKRNAARNRTVLSIMVDSGSTTHTWVENFLSTSSFPLRVPIENATETSDPDTEQTAKDRGTGRKQFRHRQVEPSMLTNSLAIAELIGSDSNKHRRQMILRVIGGTERPERRSLSGDFALLWTRMLKGMGGVDLTVVGTTGIRENRHGAWSLYMDDPIECELKREFLHMAGFKIVICDSSKILSGSCLHEYAPVNENSVDLIVTDDPFPDGAVDVDTDSYHHFQSFMEGAREQNVGVMAVSQGPSKPAKAAKT